MICYKFNYKGEDTIQTITTACGSSIYLGIWVEEGESLNGGSTISETGYVLIPITTPNTPSTTNYTFTITGTVDETSYTHTISIKVISNAVSYGEITSV